MSAEIWYMDSEFCDVCDTLLDGFGVCPECGYDGGYYEDEDDWFWWEEDMYDENQAIVRKPSAEENTTL